MLIFQGVFDLTMPIESMYSILFTYTFTIVKHQNLTKCRQRFHTWILWDVSLWKNNQTTLQLFEKYHHEMWTCLHHVHPFGTVLVGLSRCGKLFWSVFGFESFGWWKKNEQLRKTKGPRPSVQHTTTYYGKHELLLSMENWVVFSHINWHWVVVHFVHEQYHNIIQSNSFNHQNPSRSGDIHILHMDAFQKVTARRKVWPTWHWSVGMMLPFRFIYSISISVLKIGSW